jgi:hypothetical protein
MVSPALSDNPALLVGPALPQKEHRKNYHLKGGAIRQPLLVGPALPQKEHRSMAPAALRNFQANASSAQSWYLTPERRRLARPLYW